jgi:hypothetical protein
MPVQTKIFVEICYVSGLMPVISGLLFLPTNVSENA